MSDTVLTTKPAINRGLLSALLPITFIRDFKLYSSELECELTEEVEKILPQLEMFLDTINEITDNQFYFEITSSKIGLLKIYDAECLNFNENLLFGDYSNNDK